MSRDVIVKTSVMEVGIGHLDAKPAWESEPTDEGAIVRLDVSINGRLFFTFTDAEEFDGAYTSVEVTKADLVNLDRSLTDIIHGGTRVTVPGFGDVIIGPSQEEQEQRRQERLKNSPFMAQRAESKEE